MKIIFAQGNPGARYSSTRHNIGFTMLDHLANKWEVPFSKKPKFQAEIAQTTQANTPVLLVKPSTFYNETGLSARLLTDFYHLNPATDFLVIHDDLALPFGTIRTRAKGSDAGNNGIKSLNTHLGPEYNRIRIGIYSSIHDHTDDADFVLSHFTAQEKEAIPALYPQVETFIDQFIRGQLEFTKTAIPPKA